MKKVELLAHAKINLSLDVLNKRPDGYHEVKMIMQTLDLSDSVIIEEKRGEIEIECNSPWVPSNSQNIAFKAASLLIDSFGIQSGVRIKIIKRIPVAAGLAGGSSDAAAVFKGMNELFSLGISEQDLMSSGKQIGADVPYCIKGGTMLSEGIGEILTGIKPLPKTDIVLVKPKIGVSTAWVYKNLDLEKVTSRPETDKLIKAIEDNDLSFLAQNMKNVLEGVTIPKHNIIQQIKLKLNSKGALGSMMSGSGPTVFGIFKDHKSASEAFEEIKDDKRWDCFLTYTY